jgi:hypothetical protein
MYVVYMRKYYDGEKKGEPNILIDLLLLNSPEYEKVVFGLQPVCMYLWMCASLALDRFSSYLVFKALSIICPCPVNMNIPTPKIEALQTDPKHKLAMFLKKLQTILIELQ